MLAAAAVLALVALDGVRRVRVQDSWLDGFAPGSGFAQSMRRFDRDFLGTSILRVTVTAQPARFAGTVEGRAIEDRRVTAAWPHAGPQAWPQGIPSRSDWRGAGCG